MECAPVHINDRAGRQRLKDCHCYPKKIYLRVIVPAPKEHLKFDSDHSSMSSAVPRRYTMVAKEMSFELGKIIRYDTYGEIRLAHSTTSSKTIAVKCIRKNQPQMQGYVKYILPREIALLKMLKGHPNVISFIGVLDANHYAMVATEHVEGKSLMEFIRMKHSIREDEARVIFRELLSTVITCHSLGISIRGLTCENILLDKSLTPKVSTFEHAIVRGYDKVDIFEGTPSSPPEVFDGKEYDSKQVDVWTLGIILYTMVTGTQPCSEDNLDRSKKFSHFTFPTFMSSQCCKLIEKMLHPNPRRRISTSELKRDNWVNDLTLRTVEYQLAYESDTTSEDEANMKLKSARLRAMQAHHCNTNQHQPHADCDFCKSRFNMTNAKRLTPPELNSASDLESEKYHTKDEEEDDDHVCMKRSKKNLGTIKAEKAIHRSSRRTFTSGRKRRSLSTSRIDHAKGKIHMDSSSPQKYDIQFSKSMESVSVAGNITGSDKCADDGVKSYSGDNDNNNISSTDIEIRHFLNEERRHLVNTNMILAEEKKFLDQFARYLEQKNKPCAATSISGINIPTSKRQLMNRSTSYDRMFHANKTTSCSPPRHGSICTKQHDAEVAAVVDTANQLSQWNENGSIKSKGDACSREVKNSKKRPQKTITIPKSKKRVHRNKHSHHAKSDTSPVEAKHQKHSEVEQKSSSSSKTTEIKSKLSSGSTNLSTDDQSRITVKKKESGPSLRKIQSHINTKDKKVHPTKHGIPKKSVSTGQIGVTPTKKSTLQKFFSLFKLHSPSDSRILSFLKSKSSKSSKDSSNCKVNSQTSANDTESLPQKSKRNKVLKSRKNDVSLSDLNTGQSSGSFTKRKYSSKSSTVHNRRTRNSFRNMMRRAKSSIVNITANRRK